MGINGIGAAGYPVTGYTTKRTQQNATEKGFAEQVNNVASAKPHTSVVYMKTDDMLYSGGKRLGGLHCWR